MKKQTLIDNDFILEAHVQACQEFKTKIEEQAPELFRDRFEQGKWYKDNEHDMFYINENPNNSSFSVYGFLNGGWRDRFSVGRTWITSGECKEATKEEVEAALIAEAKKRGFIHGANFIGIGSERETLVDLNTTPNEWQFDINKNSLSHYCNNYFFSKGKWATIIEEPEEITIEQIQKELGRKIKIVV
jgi:hypothetical protein